MRVRHVFPKSVDRKKTKNAEIGGRDWLKILFALWEPEASKTSKFWLFVVTITEFQSCDYRTFDRKILFSFVFIWIKDFYYTVILVSSELVWLTRPHVLPTEKNKTEI